MKNLICVRNSWMPGEGRGFAFFLFLIQLKYPEKRSWQQNGMVRHKLWNIKELLIHRIFAIKSMRQQ